MSDAAIKAALDAAHEANRDQRDFYDHVPTYEGTAAAIAAFLSSMAGAGVSLAHMHDWHDLAARVEEAARDDR